jgi:hypothetical protein
VFAPLDRDNNLERFAGGNETEVYRTDDQRYVVKLKSHLGGATPEAVQLAQQMRGAAERFADCLGVQYSIPTYFIVSGDSAGHAQVVAIQPFVADAAPLHDTDWAALPPATRRAVARQLRAIIGRSLRMYIATGRMPDLYGRTSTSSAERARLNTPLMLPYRLWGFLVRRNLLRSHNLLLEPSADPQVILVDYDPVRRGPLYQAIYYAVRVALFGRDLLFIAWLGR